MLDWQSTVELTNTVRELARNHLEGMGTGWLNPSYVAAGAVVAGVILALWGSRILRLALVLACLVVGASIGRRMAQSLQVDVLIGVLVGAVICGLMAYFMYRWWVGMVTGGLVALLVLVIFAGPKLLNERQAYDDSRLGVGSGRYELPSAGMPLYSTPADYGEQFGSYLWSQRREAVYRTLGPVAVAGVCGMIVGLLMPRLATILWTSLVGVAAAMGGGGFLMASMWPETWAKVQSNASWLVGVAVVAFGLSVMYQATHTRRRPAVEPLTTLPTPAGA